MIERVGRQRAQISRRRNPCRCFDTVMIFLTLLLYCLAFIETINGDTFPTIDVSNISSSEQEELSFGDAVVVNASIDDLQNTTVVNDTEVPATMETTRTTMDITDVTQQQSKYHSVVHNDTSTISYDYSTAQEDDYTYDNDVSIGTFETKVSTTTSSASSASNDQLDFSAIQEPQQRVPYDIETDSIDDTTSNDEVIGPFMNRTEPLSNLSTLDVLTVDDNSTLVSDQQYDVANPGQIIQETEAQYGLLHQGEDPLIEATSAMDAPSPETLPIGTEALNFTEEQGNALKIDDDESDSSMSDEEKVGSDQSIVGLVDDKGPMNHSQTCSDSQNQTHHSYCSTIWGDRNVTRRRPSTNLSTLEQLFRGILEHTELSTLTATVRTHNSTWRGTVANSTENRKRPSQNNDNIDGFDTRHKLNLSDDTKIEHHDEVLSKYSEDTSLVYDIDDFFQDADITDEFDVSTKDSSIQEVLMGSATRLVVKRCTIAGRFIWSKIRTAQQYIFRHLRILSEKNETLKKLSDHIRAIKETSWFSTIKDGELALMQWMQNEDGEFAPLRRLRNTDGEWTMVKNLKRHNGELFGITKQQIQNGFEWFRINAMNVLKQVDKFLDSIFSGSNAGVDDELNFKFLNDKDFHMNDIVTDA